MLRRTFGYALEKIESGHSDVRTAMNVYVHAAKEAEKKSAASQDVYALNDFLITRFSHG